MHYVKKDTTIFVKLSTTTNGSPYARLFKQNELIQRLEAKNMYLANVVPLSKGATENILRGEEEEARIILCFRQYVEVLTHVLLQERMSG